MRLIFKPWTNTVARVSALGAPLLAVGALSGLLLYVRSPFYTEQANEVVQPVQFDHRHHVSDVGIDCRYCHQTVEKAASAGFPSTQLCLNCHSQVWNKSPLLDIVRQSYFTDQAIPWKKVHRLPDYVYFNHSIHVNKGVGCESCHGRVDQMPAINQQAPLTMGWCLECHRNPENFLRPKDQVTTMGYEPSKNGEAVAQADLGRDLIHQNAVRTRIACTTCHR
jgi:hypothetical protein